MMANSQSSRQMHPGYASIDDSDIPAEASIPVRDASPMHDYDAADNVWLLNPVLTTAPAFIALEVVDGRVELVTGPCCAGFLAQPSQYCRCCHSEHWRLPCQHGRGGYNAWYTRAWCCLGLVFSSSQLVRSIYRYNMILAARPLHIRFSKQPQMLNWSRRLSSTSFQ